LHGNSPLLDSTVYVDSLPTETIALAVKKILRHNMFPQGILFYLMYVKEE